MARSILVIGRCDYMRSLLLDVMGKEFHFLWAATNEDGLSTLKKSFKRISAVLLDVSSSDLDGFCFLKSVHKQAIFMQIPIIVISDTDEEHFRIRAVELGAIGLWKKTSDPKLLYSTTQNAISLRENASLGNALRHDKLTALLSMDAFCFEAARLVRRHIPGYYVLSCIDIENFQWINNWHGTELGDAVLRHVAFCIAKSISPIDGIVCRVYGDQFAALYPASYIDSDLICNYHDFAILPGCLDKPIRLRVGRYIIHDPSLPINAIYDKAAMAEKSIKGRYNQYVAQYDEAMHGELVRKQQIISEMRDALVAGDFEVWFQPQYNHLTKRAFGAEALVRWRRGDKLIAPGEFIPLFEQTGFIYEMDKYIWNQVCMLQRNWLDAGYSVLPVSVNISRIDLLHDEVIDYLTHLLALYRLPHDLIRLEITESAFCEERDKIVSMANALIDAGFTVEIDDFGSGYSSLNTLKDVPAHILKLDMRFIDNTNHHDRSKKIIKSVVHMAKQLGMSVIVEGVESKEQADAQSEIGCYSIQGYFYAKPMPAHEYEHLLIDSTAIKTS